MSNENSLFSESFYRDTWRFLQEPDNREIVKSLEGENQLDEEDVLERVDLSENEFYDSAEGLEEAGILNHYDREHSRGPQTIHMSLFRVAYPAERALEFDDQEKYVRHMLNEDEEMLEQYQGDF